MFHYFVRRKSENGTCERSFIAHQMWSGWEILNLAPSKYCLAVLLWNAILFVTTFSPEMLVTVDLTVFIAQLLGEECTKFSATLMLNCSVNPLFIFRNTFQRSVRSAVSQLLNSCNMHEHSFCTFVYLIYRPRKESSTSAPLAHNDHTIQHI